MPAETDVINRGLRLIGAQPIVSRTDGTPPANAANDIYDEVRLALLQSHPWNFATKRVKLAQSSTTPIFEFDYGYPLPSDWVRTVSVHDNDAGHGTVLFRMEIIGTQRAIVTSSDEIWLRYIADISDPNLMTADFRKALEESLGRDLAIPLASSNRMQNDLAKQAALSISAARSSDAMGSFPEFRPRGSWTSSRGGNRRNEFFSD